MTGLRVIILLVSSIIAIGEGNIVVDTNSGKVEGVVVKSIVKNEKFYSFMGIPYAEPPVGKLRFMAPTPHKGWSDVLKVKKEKSSCPQQNFSIRNKRNQGYRGTEDCLHLSIYTPKLPDEQPLNLPVIVFMYSEQVRFSHNASKEFGPDFFMNEGVILVQLHHRLGSFGFLSFEDDYLPGNNGLRDIILALNWLKSNIENFGGDPDKITLMGSGSSAAFVNILLHSPKAKGLFAAAILQDDTAWNSAYFNGNARKRAIALSEQVEMPASTSSFLMKQLADIPADIITEKEDYVVHADEARSLQIGVIPFGPVVEHDHPDAVITKLPEDSPLDIDIPILIGRNSREGIEHCTHYFDKPQLLNFADRDFLVMIPLRLNFHFELNTDLYYKVIEEIKKYYFQDGYIRMGGIGELIDYLGDILSFYPLDYTVRKYVNESKSPVYYYTFDYSGEFNMRKQLALENAVTLDGTWGASTADDLCYLFLCKPIKKTYIKAMEDEDSEDMKVLKKMVRMWADFARTHNPTPPGEDFIWEPATKEGRDSLLINDGLQMVKQIYNETVTFWDDFFKKYKHMAVDGVVKVIKDEL